jgi:hypothetical protein
MKYIKSLKEAYNPHVSGYINDEYKYEVTNGGPITAAEYGSVVLKFEKDGKWHEINFDIYEITNGIKFIEIENLEIAKKLDIPIEGEDRLDSNDELYGIIFDLYRLKHTSGEIPKSLQSGIYRDMGYHLEVVSAEGVIEEGWLELVIYSKDETDSSEVSFDIRETSDGDAEVTPNSDEDEERLEELGIEFDDDLQTQIMEIYGRWSNETRYPYLDSVQTRYQKHISMFEEFSETNRWKIYSGLGGGLGGRHYKKTITGTRQEAETLAYQYAIEEYTRDDERYDQPENWQDGMEKPDFIEDSIEERVKSQRYKGRKIPGKYLAGPQPGKMKKEIDKFRGKKEYKKDWDADYNSGKGGVGKRVKTKKSKATLAYQKKFGKK